MKTKRVLELVERYERRFTQTPPIVPKEFTSSGVVPNRKDILAHVLWCCEEARRYAAKGDRPKASNFVKFAQGALFGAGVMVINELKEDPADTEDSPAESEAAQ